MPDQTTIRKFVASLQTGETNTTRALDDLWRQRGTLDPGNLANLANIRLTPLEPWVRQELEQRGLSEGELQHIDGWPEPAKRKALTRLVQAHQANRDVKFGWELYRGDAEDTDIVEADPPAPVAVVFLSPRKKLSMTQWPTVGDITVDV